MFKAILFFALVVLVCALGGWQRAHEEDEGVLEAAHHAARGLSKQFASKYHHRLLKVLKAEKQIVAGVNYRMDVIVGETECRKADTGFADESCDFHDDISAYKKCTVAVNRDLEGNHKLVSTGCILATRNEVNA